nr:hypothetical protein [Tanacetum cinerariifolium]
MRTSKHGTLPMLQPRSNEVKFIKSSFQCQITVWRNLTMEILPEPTSNKIYGSAAAKPCQEDLFEFYLITSSIYTDKRGTVVIATVFGKVTKTLLSISVDYHKHKLADYYNHQDSRIKKAQELKTKTSANSDIQDPPLRYQVCQGRLLASFQDDAKYEHVDQDTRSQGGKDVKEKDLKIAKSKTKSKDDDKDSRSNITQHEGTSLQRR